MDLLRLKVDPEKIGLIVGPGGKTIRALEEQSGAEVEIEDDGNVTISSNSLESVQRAKRMIEAITEDL